MKKLLRSKYSNVLELIQEKGKIPVRCIDDGDLEALTYEIEELGYKCRLDPSTDFLVVERVDERPEIEALKEIGNITLNSKELEDVMPLVYEYLEEMFKGFAADPNNKATEEELKDFQEGRYLVAIYFGDKRITYTVGRDAQQLANEPDWAEDSWNDIETEELAALLKVAKQG